MILLEGRYGSMIRMLQLLKSVNKWKRLAGILPKTALRSSPALTFFGNIRYVLHVANNNKNIFFLTIDIIG
jgi:hypothetical protein